MLGRVQIVPLLAHQRLAPKRSALHRQLALTRSKAHAAPLQRVHSSLRTLVRPVVQTQTVTHVEVQRRHPLVKAVHRPAFRATHELKYPTSRVREMRARKCAVWASIKACYSTGHAMSGAGEETDNERKVREMAEDRLNEMEQLFYKNIKPLRTRYKNEYQNYISKKVPKTQVSDARKKLNEKRSIMARSLMQEQINLGKFSPFTESTDPDTNEYFVTHTMIVRSVSTRTMSEKTSVHWKTTPITTTDTSKFTYEILKNILDLNKDPSTDSLHEQTVNISNSRFFEIVEDMIPKNLGSRAVATNNIRSLDKYWVLSRTDENTPQKTIRHTFEGIKVVLIEIESQLKVLNDNSQENEFLSEKSLELFNNIIKTNTHLNCRTITLIYQIDDFLYKHQLQVYNLTSKDNTKCCKVYTFTGDIEAKGTALNMITPRQVKNLKFEEKPFYVKFKNKNPNLPDRKVKHVSEFHLQCLVTSLIFPKLKQEQVTELNTTKTKANILDHVHCFYTGQTEQNWCGMYIICENVIAGAFVQSPPLTYRQKILKDIARNAAAGSAVLAKQQRNRHQQHAQSGNERVSIGNGSESDEAEETDASAAADVDPQGRGGQNGIVQTVPANHQHTPVYANGHGAGFNPNPFTHHGAHFHQNQFVPRWEFMNFQQETVLHMNHRVSLQQFHPVEQMAANTCVDLQRLARDTYNDIGHAHNRISQLEFNMVRQNLDERIGRIIKLKYGSESILSQFFNEVCYPGNVHAVYKLEAKNTQFVFGKQQDIIFKVKNDGHYVWYQSQTFPETEETGHLFQLRYVETTETWEIHKIPYTKKQITKQNTTYYVPELDQTKAELLAVSVFNRVSKIGLLAGVHFKLSNLNGRDETQVDIPPGKQPKFMSKKGITMPQLQSDAQGLLPVGARRSSRQLAGGWRRGQGEPCGWANPMLKAGAAQRWGQNPTLSGEGLRRPGQNPTLKAVLSDLTEIKRVLNEEALLNAGMKNIASGRIIEID